MLMVDAQTAKGGRAGPTFHDAGGRGGRTFGSKRTILVDILGLPFACRVDPARPHDVASARLLLTDELPALPRLRAVVADRAYRGLGRLAAKRGLALDIKAPPKGLSRFVPIRPLYKVEHAFAQLGRWRRLSRCYKQTEASAQAWLGVAALGYLFARMRVEPAEPSSRSAHGSGGSIPPAMLAGQTSAPQPTLRRVPMPAGGTTPHRSARDTPTTDLAAAEEFGYRP